ncbi:MAG: hypothetical protein ACJ738_03070 [Gaiellales bacterium]
MLQSPHLRAGRVVLVRLPVALAACAAAAAIRPASADAHASSGRISTSFEARIDGIRPPVPGVTATVLDGDLKLRIDADPPHVVTVLGVLHEPFIRIGPGGVFVSSRSPTAESAGLVTLPQMRDARWIRLSGGHSFAWHESRLRPVPFVTGVNRRVAAWSIPLLVDGRPVTVRGSEWYAAQPRRLLWALPAVAAVILAAIVLATRRERLIWMAAAVGLVLALVTWMTGWIGVLLDQRLSTWPLAVSVLYAISVVLVVAAAVTAPRRAPERMVTVGAVGFLVATFTLPALGVFQRGFVLSALPATAARACVTLALGCGTGVALLALPSLMSSLRRSHPPASGRERNEQLERLGDQL